MTIGLRWAWSWRRTRFLRLGSTRSTVSDIWRPRLAFRTSRWCQSARSAIHQWTRLQVGRLGDCGKRWPANRAHPEPNNPAARFNYYTGPVSQRHTIDSGDLLFSWSGSRGTSFGAHIWSGGKAVLNQHIFKVVLDESRVMKKYMYRALNRAVIEIEAKLRGGVGLVHVTKGDLERTEIPLPPLELQSEITVEIEGYQRVIDGACAVIANYRPYFPVSAELADCRTARCSQREAEERHAGQPVDRVTDLKVLSLSATTSGTLDLSKFKYLDEEVSSTLPAVVARGTSTFSAAIPLNWSAPPRYSMSRPPISSIPIS